MPVNQNFANQLSQKAVSILPAFCGAADEGSFFVATNPTPGTPIATTTSITAETQTSPVLVITNNNALSASGQGKSIYPVYIRMLLSQVPTGATSWQCSMRLDRGVNKVTSGGSVLLGEGTGGTNSSGSSGAICTFGAIVAVAMNPTTGRIVHRSQINSAVPVTGDQWLFTFGDYSMSTNVLSGGAAAKNTTIPCAPVEIAPTWNLAIQMWGASNAAAPSWEVEIGYVERFSGQ